MLIVIFISVFREKFPITLVFYLPRSISPRLFYPTNSKQQIPLKLLRLLLTCKVQKQKLPELTCFQSLVLKPLVACLPSYSTQLHGFLNPKHPHKDRFFPFWFLPQSMNFHHKNQQKYPDSFEQADSVHLTLSLQPLNFSISLKTK